MSSNIHVQIIFESYMIVSHCYLGSPRIPRGPADSAYFSWNVATGGCRWRLKKPGSFMRSTAGGFGWFLERRWMVKGYAGGFDHRIITHSIRLYRMIFLQYVLHVFATGCGSKMIPLFLAVGVGCQENGGDESWYSFQHTFSLAPRL